MKAACIASIMLSNHYCTITGIEKHLKVSWLEAFLNANPRHTFAVLKISLFSFLQLILVTSGKVLNIS